MSFYDLYGFSGLDLDSAKDILEPILNIQFDSKESSYQGRNYYKSG